MASFNCLIVSGNLGKDPEVNATPDGIPYCKTTIAVSKWSKKEGESTMWLSVTAWRNTADYMGAYCTKGSKVLLRGKLDVRQYTDRNGILKTSTEIIADEVILFSKVEKQADPIEELEAEFP